MLKMKKETYKVTSESSQHLQFYSNKSVKKDWFYSVPVHYTCKCVFQTYESILVATYTLYASIMYFIIIYYY